MTTTKYTDAEFLLMTTELTDEIQKRGTFGCQDAVMLVNEFQFFACNPIDNILFCYPTGKGLINPVTGKVSKAISFKRPPPNDVAMRVLDADNAITQMALDLIKVFADHMGKVDDDSLVYLVIKTIISKNYYAPFDPRVKMLNTTDLCYYTMHSFESYKDFIAKATEWQWRYSYL